MTAPIVNIVSVNKTKISHQNGQNQVDVVFNFDQPIQAYSINILGTSPDTGTIAGSQSKYINDIRNISINDLKNETIQSIRQIDENTNLTEIIDDLEVGVQANDGQYRINIYGKALDGTWTPYNQS
jgi:hypothetical protein